MAVIQRRRGPNIIGFFGLLQPFADGLKLFLKESTIPFMSNKIIFIFSPIFTFFISLIFWTLLPVSSNFLIISTRIDLLIVFAVSSLGVYGFILSGWSGNSVYALLGSLRSACQLVSYEITLSLTLLPVIIIVRSYNFSDIINYQSMSGYSFIFFLFPSAISYFICLLAETNRTPFDLPEAEGELVAGYNVEYSSMFFALFYLAEYLNIIFMSFLYVIFFFGSTVLSFNEYLNIIFMSVKIICIVVFIIIIRATVPRFRFDQLIGICWKVLLPFNFGYCVYISGLTIFLYQLSLFFL